MIIESCVDNADTAISAEHNGAHQIELCANLELDGLTPDANLFKAVYDQVSIDIKVMIRPRSGNFVYSEIELSQMETEIKIFKQFKVAGFVFGCLTEDKSIDISKTQRLCDLAHPFPCTFHKAIDEVVDLEKAIRDLNSINGINFILSSGTKKTALEGATILNDMIKWSADHIHIIAAGKITNQNLKEIQSKIKTAYFHGKLIV